MKKKYMIGIAVAIVAIIAIGAGYYWFTSSDKPYNYNLDEYVKVGKYKGLEYSINKQKISDKDVDGFINNQLQQSTSLQDVKDGKVEDGMTVNVDYEGKINGKAFEGGTAKNQNLVIGQSQMIEGFIEGLKGHKVGDTVTLNLKFPKNYRAKDVAGKAVVFTVKINKIQKPVTPKLDDEFVKTHSKDKTVAEYKKTIATGLQKQADQAAVAQAKQELWQKVINDSKVLKYPEKEMEDANKKADEWAKQYKAQAKQYGMKWDEFLKTAMHTDKKGFEKIKKKYAQDIVKNNLVLYSVAKKENISISDSDYDKKIKSILKNANMTEEQFKKQYKMTIKEFGEKQQWRTAMLLEKVVEQVMKDGKKVEAKTKTSK